MADTERIQLAHGGGGQLTAELIEQVILPALGTQQAGQLTDAATLSGLGGEVVFTTDSYVVKPPEFPGGNIGKLAVCGTVNDLAVCGAIPKALSLGVIIEEGLEIDLLSRVLKTLGETASAAGVAVVTGDTKVVERGALDGIMLNTAGIGVMSGKANLGFERICEGDAVILSGPLGEHGMAVMGMRKGLSFSADLISDCACIHSYPQWRHASQYSPNRTIVWDYGIGFDGLLHTQDHGIFSRRSTVNGGHWNIIDGYGLDGCGICRDVLWPFDDGPGHARPGTECRTMGTKLGRRESRAHAPGADVRADDPRRRTGHRRSARGEARQGCGCLQGEAGVLEHRHGHGLFGGALRRRDSCPSAGGVAKQRAVSKGFHVPANQDGAFPLEITICDLK